MSSGVPYNPIKATEPTQYDLQNFLKRDIFLNLNCHAVGVIQEFDKDEQVAKVKIAYQKINIVQDKAGNYVQRLQPYPMLIDCPVFVLGGGRSRITMPIKPNDECIVLFNDRSIDEWWRSGQNTPISSGRAHSMSDAIILVGINSLPNAYDDYNDEEPEIRHNETKLTIGDKVEISNDSQNLYSVLTELISKLNELSTTIGQITVSGVTSGGGTSGVPRNKVQFDIIASDINSIGSKLGEILK